MSYANLIPVPDSEFNPFFFGESEQPAKKPYYKTYHDGGHYIATRCGCKCKTVPHKHKEWFCRTECDHGGFFTKNIKNDRKPGVCRLYRFETDVILFTKSSGCTERQLGE